MSKNDGGEPVKLSRDTMEAPQIPRGAMFPRNVPRGAEQVTFQLLVSPFLLTYHDAAVISDGSMTAAQVFVTPHDVVTWERL